MANGGPVPPMDRQMDPGPEWHDGRGVDPRPPVFQLDHLPSSGVFQFTGQGLKRVLAQPQRQLRNVTDE